MWINITLVIFIIILLLALSMVWPPDSPWAPWWRTKDHQIRESLKLAKVTKKDVVYDLGSGDGRVLLVAAKEFRARGVGIEIDPLRAFLSTLLLRCNKVNNEVIIKRKNFFNEDISGATVIFLYLVPKALGRLKQKLLSDLKKGTRIITIKYDFPEKAGLSKIAENKKLGIKIYRIFNLRYTQRIK